MNLLIPGTPDYSYNQRRAAVIVPHANQSLSPCPKSGYHTISTRERIDPISTPAQSGVYPPASRSNSDFAGSYQKPFSSSPPTRTHANAHAIHSMRGGGENGHLDVLMSWLT